MRIKVFLVLMVVSGSVSLFAGCDVKKIPFVNSQIEKYEKGREERLDELISKNPDLKILADVCNKLGSLQDFSLAGRDMSTHGRPALYYYYNSKMPLSETSKVFTSFLESDGWHSIENISMNPTLAFQKGELRVTIQYGGIGEAEYGITCEEIPEGER